MNKEKLVGLDGSIIYVDDNDRKEFDEFTRRKNRRVEIYVNNPPLTPQNIYSENRP